MRAVQRASRAWMGGGLPLDQCAVHVWYSIGQHRVLLRQHTVPSGPGQENSANTLVVCTR